MALDAETQKKMLTAITAIRRQFEALGVLIVDQHRDGMLDQRTAPVTHDLLLEGMVGIVDLQSAIESGFAPGPAAVALGVQTYWPSPAQVEAARQERERREAVADPRTQGQRMNDALDLERLHSEAPEATEPARLPPVRDDELPPWGFVTHDAPDN